MKPVLITFLIVCSIGLLTAQSTVESLKTERKQMEVELERLRNRTIELSGELETINSEIGRLELEDLKGGDLQVSIGERKPYLLFDEYQSNGRLQEGEVVTIISYAPDIDKIKVYSPSLDAIGYLVPIIFRSNRKVEAYIEQPVNRKNHKAEGKKKKSVQSKSARSSSAGRTYHRGPRGGCYYIDSRGNKQYVERSKCG